MTQRFIQLAEVSEILNISSAQAYALVRSGELPAIKVGGRGQWRVEATELESYIQRMYAETQDLRGGPPVRRHGRGVSSAAARPAAPGQAVRSAATADERHQPLAGDVRRRRRGSSDGVLASSSGRPRPRRWCRSPWHPSTSASATTARSRLTARRA